MDPDDSFLVISTLAGDKAPFGHLVERDWSRAHRLATHMLCNSAEAEDVAQEACLQAFLGLEHLRDPERFASWLCGIAVNLSRMRLRNRGRQVSLGDLEGGRVANGFTSADLEPSPEASREFRELHELTRAVINLLPVEYRAAVRLHYFDGLTASEIGVLVGAPTGTIKARLHRARQKLRFELSREIGTREMQPQSKEVNKMVELTVHDVLARWTVKEGRPEEHHGHKRIVLLRENIGGRILPIWVGPHEADDIAMQLAQKSLTRPLAYDLMARLLTTAHMTLERAAVTRLHEDLFYATLWVRVNEELHEIDARPSDAISLALRVKAPIFANEDVVDKVAILPDAFHAKLDQELREELEKDKDEPSATENASMDWKSVPELFRSLPLDVLMHQ
jgi:RNA polymerase sigma factor (sigma-70 family)